MHHGMVNLQVVFIFNGFFEPQNSAKNAKKFAKMRRAKNTDDAAFTMLALTMIRPYANPLGGPNPGSGIADGVRCTLSQQQNEQERGVHEAPKASAVIKN